MELAAYWSGIHAALNGRLQSIKEALRHPSSGGNAEAYFRDLIRQYLPTRYSIETGFVVNAQGERSDLMDALIVDTHVIAPLSAEPHFKVFPAEAVLAAIEITSAPKSKVPRKGIEGRIEKIEDDLLKLAKVRKIAKRRAYILPALVQATAQGAPRPGEIRLDYELAPRAYLITCGDEWVKRETYERHILASLTSASARRSEVWLNAAFSMKHGMLNFRPYVTYEAEWRGRNPMLEFILTLNDSVSRIQTGRIDVRRYRPTLPALGESNGDQNTHDRGTKSRKRSPRRPRKREG
jgi:hypothetical protein